MITGFWIFMFLMAFLMPFTMIGFGRLFVKNTPEDINVAFGYRTKRSMKNKQTWVFAHQYCGRLWQKLGLILLVASIIFMIPFYSASIDRVGTAGSGLILFQVVVMMISIWPVEKALKENFDEHGKRKQQRETDHE